MKFEQAFYTFGLNQLSKYKEGLGICAASRLEEDFLDNCLLLGSYFNSEYTARTAEFTLYSKEFRTFVGVGISPREDGGDGRTNKLCHFFIPVEREPGKEPRQYLLEYPFRREVTDHEEIAQAELEPAVYEYQGILEKYALHGKKLAMLLWKAYPCAFDETQNLIFVIDGAKHEVEEYGQMAREVTWLLSMLLPVPDRRPDFYRSRISYGVYTTENVKAVRFIFTDREDMGDNRFYMDSEPEPGLRIPQVYEAMAEWTEKSRECFQEKLNDMMRWKFSEKVQSSQLLLMYFRWKLEQKEGGLSFDDLEDEMDRLLIRAIKSPWHKQFLVKYLKQEKQMSNKWLVSIWKKFLYPEMKSYDDMGQDDKQEFEDAVINVICMIHGQNTKNYELFLKRISEIPELENHVLHTIYAQRGGASYITEEVKGCETIESFCECVSRYSVLCDVDELKKVFLERALSLYKHACREGRGVISHEMHKLDQEAWEEKLRKYISNCFGEHDAYMDILESEMGKIEIQYVEIYYKWLLYFFKKEEQENKSDSPEWKRARKYGEELQRIGTIGETNVKELNELIDKCEKREIINKINKESLDDLATREIHELRYDLCKKFWIECMIREMERLYSVKKENISGITFQKLVNNMEDIIFWGDNAHEYSLYKKYAENLYNIVNDKLKRRVQFYSTLYKCNVDIELPDFWQNINPDKFEEIYAILKGNKDWSLINNKRDLDEKSIFNRDCYIIWECIRENKEISISTDYRYHAYRKNWGEFIKKYKRVISEKENPNQTDVYNFITLQLLCEDLDGGNAVTAESIRKFKRKHVLIARSVQNKMCDKKHGRTAQCWTDMKVFLDIMDYTGEVDENDVNYVERLLKSCPDRFAKEKEVEKLVEGYKKFMEIKIDRDISALTEQNEKLKKEIQELSKQLKDTDKRVGDLQRNNSEIIDYINNNVHKEIKFLKENMSGLYESSQSGDGVRNKVNSAGMEAGECNRRSQIENENPPKGCFSGSYNNVKNGKYNR